MIIYFFILFELVALPGVVIWSIESIPIKIRAILVTVMFFILCLALIDKFLKTLGMRYNEIGIKLPKKDDLKKNILLLFSGTIVCLVWLLIYLGTFKMLLPAEYARVAALKTTGYIQFLSEWGRTGGFYGTVALWCSVLLLVTIEELAFRGLIFNYMRREYSFKDALIWNTVLFTLAHINPYNFPVSFVLGLVYTMLYVKSGGLAVPISVHCAYNLSLVYFGKYLP